MATLTTTGKVKVGLALDPQAYQLLQGLASGPRGLGAVLEDLIRAEAARRAPANPQDDAQERINRLYGLAQAELVEREELVNELFDATRRLERQGRRLDMLHEIDRAILAAHSPAEIAEVAAEGLLRVTDAVRVSVVVWEPAAREMEFLAAAGAGWPFCHPGQKTPVDAAPWFAAVQRGEVVFREELQADPSMAAHAGALQAAGFRSQAIIPLMVGGQASGRLSLVRRQPGRPSDEDLALAQRVADSLAVAMQSARLLAAEQASRRQLQALSRRLVQVQEQERRALSRELHDTSGQSMTALKLGLSALGRSKELAEQARERVEWLLGLADTITDDLHRLALDLRPAALDRYGLIPALEQLLTEFRRHGGPAVVFSAAGLTELDERLPAEVETAFYRIVQESLTNIARHAQAATVAIRIERTGAAFELVVQDDGCGFDVEHALDTARLGLLGMRERAVMLGGSLDISSAAGRGTTIRARLPLMLSHAGPPARESAAPAPPVAERTAPAPLADPQLAEAAELARAKALSDVLVEIAAAAAACTDPTDLLRQVLAQTAHALGRDSANVVVREEDGWRLKHRYPDDGLARTYRHEDAPGWNRVEQTRQMLVVDDVAALEPDDPLRGAQAAIRSYASIPLLAGGGGAAGHAGQGRLLGILSVGHASGVLPFHPSEINFLNRLAHLVSLSLENILLRETEARQRAELSRQVAELETSRVVPNAELAAILESVADGLIVYDAEGRIVRRNAAAAEMLGYNASTQGQPIRERATAMRPLKADGTPFAHHEFPAVRALAGEVVRNVEMILHVPARDGGPLHMAVSSAPIRGAGGAITGCVTTFRNTEEQFRARLERERLIEAHRGQRELLERILQSAVIGVAVVSGPDHRYRYCNDAYRSIPGVSDAPMVGRAFAEVFPEVAAESALRMIEAVYRTGETVSTLEHPAYMPGRGLTYWDVHHIPMRDAAGQVEAVLIMAREVTAQVVARQQAQAQAQAARAAQAAAERMNEALQRQRAYLECILDRAGACMAVVQGEELRYTLLNPAYQAIQPGVPMLGRTYLDVFPEAAAAGGAAAVRQVLRTGEPWIIERYHSPVPGKPEAHWQGQVVRLPLAPGEPPAALISIVDDTVEALYEERLRQEAEELERRVEARTAELYQQAQRLELLREIDRSILAARAPAEIAYAASEKVRQATGSLRVAVKLFDAQMATAETFAVAGPPSPGLTVGGRMPAAWIWGADELAAGRTVVLPDIATVPDEWPLRAPRLAEGVRSATLIPMMAQGQVIGLLVTHHAAPGGLPSSELTWVGQVADSLAVAVHNAQLREKTEASQAQLQALSRRLVERQELERAHVADRLYNEAAQVLAALKMKAGVLERQGAHAAHPVDWLHELRGMTDRALIELHRLASDLRPAVLDRVGLAAAARQYCAEFGERNGLQVDCNAEGLAGVRLPVEVETGVYRVLQEALSNAGQYAGARCVRVTLVRAGGRLLLVVEDDGRGFDVAAALRQGGLGLVAMRERADALGGRLEVESRVGAGTRVVLEAPG